MSSYENIYEVLNGGRHEPFIGEELKGLTVDQRIAAAGVIALAAIAEELSAIVHHGIAQSGQIGPTGHARSAYEDQGVQSV